MTVRALAAAFTLILAVAALTGCQPEQEESVPDYTPRTVDELTAEIEQLPGVASVSLTFTEDVGTGPKYRGEVRLAADAGTDPLRTLDAVHAILRRGEPRATFGVGVIDPADHAAYHANELGLTNLRSIEERYGPQPGDGTPPSELP